MKLKRLLSLAGILTAMLVLTGGSLYALDAVAVQSAQGFPGGTDTVDVYITTDSAYVAAEVGLSFDKTKLSYVDGSVVVNSAAWPGGAPEVSVDSATGKVNVAFFSLDPNIRLVQAASPLKLFSLVLKVDSSATPGTAMVTPDGQYTSASDIINSAPDRVVTNLSAGTFTILSAYSLSADSVTASIGAPVAVPIYLTNINPVVGMEFTLNFDSNQLAYADSVVLNSAIWSEAPQPVQVDTAAGQVKVAIFTLSAGSIAPNNEEVRVATVYLRPVADAFETASNPLTFSAVIVTSRNPDFSTVENLPNLIPGNVNISGKYALRVSTDAAAPLGGSDTVRVYLKNAETVVGAQATLWFDQSKYTTSAAQVIFNPNIFSATGSVQSEVALTDSSVSVTGFVVSNDSIVASDADKLLFSVILNVKSTAAAGYDSLDVTGVVSVRNPDYSVDPVTVGSLTRGAFLIRSPFELEVEDTYSLPSTTKRVNILLTNRDSIAGADATIKFNSSLLSYVANSVLVNSTIWKNGVPTATVLAGGDSVKIVLFESGAQLVSGGGAGQLLLSLEFTVLPAFTSGMSTPITISGHVAVPPDFPDVVVTGITGTFNVISDITPPGRVTNITASRVNGDADILLAWTNPIDVDLARVVIVRKSLGQADVTIFSGIATSFTDVGIDQQKHTYIFTAYDNVGNASEADSIIIGSDVRPGIDFNRDGRISGGDLYYYVANPTLVNVDSLAALIAYLLGEQCTTCGTLLASSGNGSELAQPGAAFISLNSNFETILARFTFSYDKAYAFSGAVLSPALQGKAMIVPIDRSGQLVLDVISTTPFVPSEVGGDILRVMFSNGTYNQAALKLEKVEVADRSGTVHRGEQAGIVSSAVLPKAFALEQNSPNPFNPSTTISYEIPESSGATKVVLTVFNIRGQKVSTLVDELKDAGRYSVNWNGNSDSGQRVSSGVYFYRLQAGEFSAVRKMVILK